MEIYKTKQLKRAISKIAEISEKKFIQEICGILGYDGENYVIQECKNISEKPAECFVMDPLQYLLFKEQYSTIAIFHSHIVGDETPSEFDIIMSENSCVPFLIYSLNTKNVYIHTPKHIDADEKRLEKVKQKIK